VTPLAAIPAAIGLWNLGRVLWHTLGAGGRLVVIAVVLTLILATEMFEHGMLRFGWLLPLLLVVRPTCKPMEPT
jgi:tellurite resistance protein TehA-like permease